MEPQLIALREYCLAYRAEQAFIEALENSGLITLVNVNEERFIAAERLSELETFTRWHYEMDINLEGIEALHHAVSRLQQLQGDVQRLRLRLKRYE